MGLSSPVRHAWNHAEEAMDAWQEREQAWQKIKQALQLVTPEGELNTRDQAEAVLAETLPQLPDSDFAKTKRQLQEPEMLNYLDRVQAKITALPFAQEVKEAAVRQESLRRRPEALQGETPQAAALRGVLLLCAVVLHKAGTEGLQAVAAVKDIFRRAYRASSLVECINSVLRMQQAGHRRMTQGLLDLKRLYWNSHTFGAGRRRKTTPYERLGVPWPPGLRWWEVLKLTPEQLRNKLSTTKLAA
jgi:alanyl-tRNA synthetase